MTFFPRNWPGILSIDCENKRKPEVNDSLQYQHEITREVWTNGESMVEEINRRRRDPEYLKKKIKNVLLLLMILLSEWTKYIVKVF